MYLSCQRRVIASVKTFAAPFSSSATTLSKHNDLFQPSFDPYAYTAGRWLHRDEERRAARHVSFDFDALMSHVVGCSPTASRVVDCTKLEGGFNRVFMVTLDSGEELIARLPTRHAGQPSIPMASEIATLDYVAQKTGLPVPKLLQWAGTKMNTVGTEYMFTTKLPGVSLSELWPQLSSYQHICCIESLNGVLRKLTKPSFPAYGSLYHSTLLPDKYPRVSLPDEPTFCVGPHCGMSFWVSPAQESSEHDRIARLGPFESLPDYVEGLFQAGYKQIPQSSAVQDRKRRSYEGSRDEVESLLCKSHDVMMQMLDHSFICDLSVPTLMHPDFNLRNILVRPDDPTQITGLLDWQSACIEPAFVWAADRPDFAQPMPDDPDTDGVEGQSQAQKERERDMSLCSQAWTACTLGDPKIRFAAQVDSLLLQYLTAPHSIWKDGTANHIWRLTEISNRWHDLGFSNKCAFQESDIDEQRQKGDFENSELSERLCSHLCQILGCESDGWVPIDRWGETLEHYRKIRLQWLQKLEDDPDTPSPELTDALLWPFDQR